ncbi:MAG: YkgJ family cysteine cluster protein [Planctomycetota bacterium]
MGRSCWYEDGLEFSCTQCGKCCRVEGYVWVDAEAVREIAAYLGLSDEEFGKRYVRRVKRRHSLIEKPNLECIFWDNGCTIYPVRPVQCRTFPFWRENLQNPDAWDEVTEECPGSGTGRRFTREEIDELKRGRGSTSGS